MEFGGEAKVLFRELDDSIKILRIGLTEVGELGEELFVLGEEEVEGLL